MIINDRNQGLPAIKIKHLKEQDGKIIHFPDAAFTVSAISTNFDEDDIRVDYSSLASYDLNSEKLSILKVQEIPSGSDPSSVLSSIKL